MVRRMVEGINAGEKEAVVEILFAPRAARRFERLFAQFRSAFADRHEEIVQLVAEGEAVAGRFRCSGTNQGEFRCEAPTGKHMDVEEIFFRRAEDGWFEQWDATLGSPPLPVPSQRSGTRLPRMMDQRACK